MLSAASTSATSGPLAMLDLAGGFLRRLNLVARVGEEDAPFRQNQQGAVAAGEARKIAQIGAEGHQQAIEFAPGQAGRQQPRGAARIRLLATLQLLGENLGALGETVCLAHIVVALRPLRKASRKLLIVSTSVLPRGGHFAPSHLGQNLTDLLLRLCACSFSRFNSAAGTISCTGFARSAPPAGRRTSRRSWPPAGWRGCERRGGAGRSGGRLRYRFARRTPPGPAAAAQAARHGSAGWRAEPEAEPRAQVRLPASAAQARPPSLPACRAARSRQAPRRERR